MELTLDSNNNRYTISAYEPGKIKINDIDYTKSLILSPDHLIKNWAPSSPNEITVNMLSPILELKPDIVIIGTGELPFFPKQESLAFFYQHKIGIEVMTTQAACRTFTILSSEGRNVVTGLII